MASWDFTNLVKARKVLDPIWKAALLKGRCWGPKRNKRKTNPFACSNITMALEVEEDIELVSVSQTENGELKIHEFKEVKGTRLGSRIREHLRQAGLVREVEEIPNRAVSKPVKKRRAPSHVNGTGIFGSYPVCWAVMQLLIEHSDNLVSLDQIIRNDWLIKTAYGISMHMQANPPQEEEARKKVKRAVNHLRSRGYEIETIRDNAGRLCYCTAETSIW